MIALDQVEITRLFGSDIGAVVETAAARWSWAP